MRLGIFGGSFDPVHNGHLALAQACHEQAALDEVWFTPTAVQPLKQRGPHATDAQRVEMLNLAIDDRQNAAGRPGADGTWRVCTLEIDRGGYSYTVDTLHQLHTELPEAQLFFMIGADAARDIPRWKEPAEIIRLATPLVVRRIGEAEPDLAALTSLCAAETRPMLIMMPPIDVSSTEIRSRVADGAALDGLVPLDVAGYIRRQGIYR